MCYPLASPPVNPTVRRSFLALIGAVAACSDSVAPPKPSTVVLVSAPPASLQAGATVPPVTVAVKDERGNAMSGQPLTVTVNGGTLSGTPTATQGSATSIGTWTLAGKAGTNTLTVVSGSLPPLVVAVQGLTGPPAKLSGNLAAVGLVGATVSAPIAVLDAFDNPVSGATVQLAVTAGGGSLNAPAATTNANGSVATLWTLGTLRGSNTLSASVGSVTATFTTVAQADAPAALQIVDGDSQTGDAGAPLPVAPRATVVDRFGNATPRQNVTFLVTAGGGSLTGAATVATDTDGVAVGPTWVLGKRNVAQTMSATVGGLAQTLSASIHTEFPITLRFIGTTTDAQKAVFLSAAERVTAAVIRGGPPVTALAFPLATECDLTGFAPISETIPGIIIYAGIGPIDGVGNIVAESGPCAFRSSLFLFMPAIAVIQFDEADLATLTSVGSLEDVATHEMFHALGYGLLWSTLALETGSPNADPRYIGSNGRSGCAMITTPATCAPSVPLENTGGPGTAAAHWRETVFANELMTGYLNPGANPLSVMSIASMSDLGYAVSLTAADPFSLTSALRTTIPRQSPAVPWEAVHFPAGPLDLESAGGLLVRRRKP